MSYTTEKLGALEPITVRVPDAIRMTGLSRSRLYELLRDREIEHIKVGTSTLILVASIRAWVERCRSHA